MKLHVLGLIAASAFAATAGATTLQIGNSDPYYLGLVDDGIPADQADQVGYINFLITLAPGATGSSGGQDYTRSTNVFASLPTAVLADSARDDTNPETTIDLGTGWQYLIVKYDGPNWGSEVWYIAGLTGSLTFPQYPVDEKWGISSWSLYNPSSSSSSSSSSSGEPTTSSTSGTTVPEPASSLVLLGLGLLGVGFMRRRAHTV